MGLPNFPSPVEGLFLVVIVNTIFSVALFKNMVRSALQVMSNSVSTTPTNLEHGSSTTTTTNSALCPPMPRRVSITRFGSLADVARGRSGSTGTSGGNTWCSIMESCCVCLSRFEADEEVSELSCKHFFHKGCLDKWFDDHHHTTCPLCRSIL